jgi:AraC-like DNA-binding protein/ligand-binding sensor protein
MQNRQVKNDDVGKRTRPWKNAGPGTVINRREIEPLLKKAWRVLQSYEEATGSAVAVLDRDGWAVNDLNAKGTIFFCSFCRRFSPESACRRPGNDCSAVSRRRGEDEYPCTCKHIEGINEARSMGTSYIYMCRMGFVYWISPCYSGGRFAGSLVAGRVLGIERSKAVENFYRLCLGVIKKERIENYLSSIPERNYDEIRAQAQLLHICAKRISGRTFENEDTDPVPEGVSWIRMARKNVPDVNKGHFLDKERLLLASLRRGDNRAALRILREILQDIFVLGSVEMLRLRAIELVVLLSRAKPGAETLEANNRYLKWIEDSKTAEELTGNLRTIIERMAGNLFFFHGVRHSSALLKAEKFIRENYTRKIDLREIAEISGLSAPYFSTIFKKEMGENLSAYLNRLRIEKAATMLVETDKTLNEIAGECGFEDQSWFSKIFKHYMGVSPGKYRENGEDKASVPFAADSGFVYYA